MRVLALVTEIMVDDVAMAEQMRMAAMTIWLAQGRTQDPRLCWVAWRDIRRGEVQLRRQLYQALRRGYMAYDRFDEIMSLLRKTGQPARAFRLPEALLDQTTYDHHP